MFDVRRKNVHICSKTTYTIRLPSPNPHLLKTPSSKKIPADSHPYILHPYILKTERGP